MVEYSESLIDSADLPQLLTLATQLGVLTTDVEEKEETLRSLIKQQAFVS